MKISSKRRHFQQHGRTFWNPSSHCIDLSQIAAPGNSVLSVLPWWGYRQEEGVGRSYTTFSISGEFSLEPAQMHSKEFPVQDLTCETSVYTPEQNCFWNLEAVGYLLVGNFVLLPGMSSSFYMDRRGNSKSREWINEYVLTGMSPNQNISLTFPPNRNITLCISVGFQFLLITAYCITGLKRDNWLSITYS